MAFGAPVSDPRSFWLEARHQRVCAHCGHPGGFHAHHVISKNWLRRNHHEDYDTRGALRLCEMCHMQFEWAGPGKIQLVAADLKQQNLCYVWEVMGDAGSDFLDREYAGHDDDRWTRHGEGICPECQPRA